MLDEAAYWQKEAHRYDAASRSSMSRLRTEIALGVTALSSIVALVVIHEVYPLLLGVPIVATGVWALALWSAQETFLLDAHLMYAERMAAHHLAEAGEGMFPTWADNGGNVTRTGYTQRLLILSWATATAIAVGSCIYFIAASAAPWFLLTFVILECAAFLILVGYGGLAANKAGVVLFAELEAQAQAHVAERATPRRRLGMNHARASLIHRLTSLSSRR